MTFGGILQSSGRDAALRRPPAQRADPTFSDHRSQDAVQFRTRIIRLAILLAILIAALPLLAASARAGEGVSYEGATGPGHGHRIVFLAGDEEYRSEEGLPMLAKILAMRHGFSCTVLFSINPATGDIDPDCQTNMPGLDALDTADLCVMQLRFREWPDAQMKHFVDYVNSGKPIIALRTSTHAFAYTRNKNSPYAKYDWVQPRLAGRLWTAGVGGNLDQPLRRAWKGKHPGRCQPVNEGPSHPARRDRLVVAVGCL